MFGQKACVHACFVCVLAGGTAAWTQSTPSINPGGVVNAASYAANAPVAPGSIAAVYGNFPVSTPSGAPGLPLSIQISGLSLNFGPGIPAPLFYVSSGQVNFQVPWELAAQTQSPVIATLSGQTSAPQTVPIAPFAPGIFSMNAQGTGQGAILDSSYRLVDSANPAAAGITVVQIYCTGLGPVTHQPASGSPALNSPLSVAITTPTVTIAGIPAQVLFAGLAPGFVGGYQVNALVPPNAPIGDQVPVTISGSGVTSNAVQMAVRAPTSDERATLLLSEMTQDEKLQLVHGAGGYSPIARGAGSWIPGIPRLGIPDLYLADGSVGVSGGVGQATALPSSIASAASWDLNEARKYGKVIGTELRAYGINLNLGGNVNLIGREPRDGRTFETKGEDPILAGKITAAHLRAIQDQHVLGDIKHFALNDQETGRFTANAQIDERGARESDLLAFEIGLKDSNVQSVMCSYNLVNSVYACENPHLLNVILKGEWGFKGYVMSDWGATHSTAAAVLAGLDQDQPVPANFATLGQAIQNGQVPQARLDDMVRRILGAMYETGLFYYPAEPGTLDTAAGQAIAQEVEEQGAVLLKNAGGQLPLQAAGLKSIAVIGSHADVAVLSGGGSAQVMPTGGPAITEGYPCPPCWAQVIWDPSSPLQAIKAKAPNANVQFDAGTLASSAAALAASSDLAIVFVSHVVYLGNSSSSTSLSTVGFLHVEP